jgi:hypothetical protein
MVMGENRLAIHDADVQENCRVEIQYTINAQCLCVKAINIRQS